MTVVDLRSDTLTLPSPGMQVAMSGADIGDDVFGEDPSVNRLQDRAAELLGKEAAIFVASGTMGNLLGVLSLAQAGQEVIADAESHVFLYEGAGAAALGGVQIRQLATGAGVMTPALLDPAVRPRDDVHQPLTAAACLEDTHNRHGGVVWPLDALRAVRELAIGRGLKVHLDGARLLNASVALDLPPRTIADGADTVTFCLSKGLGAPVGSVLCGSQELIGRARRWRKALGGGWRQAGVLAAAGLYALDHMVERLAEDHANARTLGEGLAELPGVELDLTRVQTNIVIFELSRMAPTHFLAECRLRGLLGGDLGGRKVRFVTRFGIGAGDVQRTLAICSQVLSG